MQQGISDKKKFSEAYQVQISIALQHASSDWSLIDIEVRRMTFTTSALFESKGNTLVVWEKASKMPGITGLACRFRPLSKTVHMTNLPSRPQEKHNAAFHKHQLASNTHQLASNTH